MPNKDHNRAIIGYWIGHQYWNKGYCSEALREIIRYGFSTLGLNRIGATHQSKNPASGRVMIKAGMWREGTLKKHILKNGEYDDVEIYGIVKGQAELF